MSGPVDNSDEIILQLVRWSLAASDRTVQFGSDLTNTKKRVTVGWLDERKKLCMTNSVDASDYQAIYGA